MLPHVQHQQRRDVDGDIALLVGELLDDQPLTDVVVAQDGPAGTLQRGGRSVEVRLELVERAELCGDGVAQLALGLASTVR